MSTRFLYYFCLCKSFKELSFCASTQIIDFSSRKSAALDIAQVNLALCSFAGFLSESECKGTTNINTLQIFKRKNSRKPKDFRDCLQLNLIPYYIYKGIIQRFRRFRCFRPPHRQTNRGRNRQANRRWHSRYNQAANPYRPAAYRVRK